jgi:hypothetical protein
MRGNLQRWLGVLCLAGTLAGSAGCPEDGTGGPLTLDQFDDAMFGALCDYITRCPGGPDDELWLLAGGGNAAECRDRIRRGIAMGGDIEAPTAPWSAAVGRGTATWDGTLAGNCLGALGSASCDAMASGAFIIENPECDQLLQGTVAASGACHIDGECSGGWCDSSASCPGTCVAYVARDGACNAMTAPCAPADECDPATSRCVAAVPETLAARGQACNVEIGPACAYDLYCDAAGTCQPGRGESESCATAPSSCGAGLYCLESDGSCHAPVLATALGAQCGDAILTMCDPLESLYCDEGGHCATLPGDGAACVNLLMCAPGNYCASGTCHAKVPIGGACEGDNYCQSGHCEGGFCVSVADGCGDSSLF